MTNDPSLQALNQLVGSWTTEATHSAFPGVVVHGTAAIEWLEGERFLISRTRTDHPKFPDAIYIIGFTNQDRVENAPTTNPAADAHRLSMHYFDSRGQRPRPGLYQGAGSDVSFSITSGRRREPGTRAARPGMLP